MKRIVKRIQEAITNPKGELTRWEKFIVYLWLLSKEGASQLADQRANMMAASLNSTVVLANAVPGLELMPGHV